MDINITKGLSGNQTLNKNWGNSKNINSIETEKKTHFFKDIWLKNDRQH